MDLILPVEDNKIWRPGARKIMDLRKTPLNFRIALLSHFALYMADVYASELIISIDTQRFKRFWQALSHNYLLKKARLGWALHIWEATGLLKKSIGFWKIKSPKGIAIGIKKDATYKTDDGTVKVRDVAFWMEYGTGDQAEGGKGRTGWHGMPARPLFRPLRDRLSKDISIHFQQFVETYRDEIDDLLVLSLFESESGAGS